jgi:lipopolysaccharide/colanic/teichoic acid biosynthesis glycosyltransferase
MGESTDYRPEVYRTSVYHSVRPALERLAALLLLVALSPLIGLLVVLIRLTSKGPGIYSQTRLGRGGAIFTMYKLRSMRLDAESKTGPVWAAVGRDPRVTPLGHWLRRSHLDELPQLYNILRGEMSLIGPRPERPAIAAVLADAIPDYLDRLRVLPGVTGLAQINLPPDTDLNSVRAKLQLDLEYIRRADWWLDIRIAACTLLRLVGLRGGRAVSWLGLHRSVDLGAIPAAAGAHCQLAVVISADEVSPAEEPAPLHPADTAMAASPG